MFMPNLLFRIIILFTAALLAGRTANAQENGQPEVSKPIALRGSIVAKIDDKGNLSITRVVSVPITEERRATRTICKTVIDTIEETYTADVAGKKEIRTRKVDVPRQVSEVEPYTYTVTICKPEVREELINPKILRVGSPFLKEVDPGIVTEVAFNHVTFDKNLPSLKGDSQCAFVKTTEEAERVNQMIVSANELLGQALGDSAKYSYIIVTGETFDYAAAAKANVEAKMNEVPATSLGSAIASWPLPTDKSAWINSLPFSQKTLNNKAMVLWFFEEDCPKCKAKWLELNSLPVLYRGKPVIFVAVNSGNSSDAVADYVKQNKVNMAVIADTDRQLEKLAGVGEISLNNIYQAAILTPDGQLHRADASDLNAAAIAAVELVK